MKAELGEPLPLGDKHVSTLGLARQDELRRQLTIDQGCKRLLSDLEGYSWLCSTGTRAVGSTEDRLS